MLFKGPVPRRLAGTAATSAPSCTNTRARLRSGETRGDDGRA